MADAQPQVTADVLPRASVAAAQLQASEGAPRQAATEADRRMAADRTAAVAVATAAVGDMGDKLRRFFPA